MDNTQLTKKSIHSLLRLIIIVVAVFDIALFTILIQRPIASVIVAQALKRYNEAKFYFFNQIYFTTPLPTFQPL